MCIETIESVGSMCRCIKGKKKYFSFLFLARVRKCENVPCIYRGAEKKSSSHVVEKHVQKFQFYVYQIFQESMNECAAKTVALLSYVRERI
jgi:hypothetical protein